MTDSTPQSEEQVCQDACINCGDGPRHRRYDDGLVWDDKGDALCAECGYSRGATAASVCCAHGEERAPKNERAAVEHDETRTHGDPVPTPAAAVYIPLERYEWLRGAEVQRDALLDERDSLREQVARLKTERALRMHDCIGHLAEHGKLAQRARWLEERIRQYDAAFELAAEDEVFFSQWNEEKQDWCGPTVPVVNCNDIFYYAADAEQATWGQMPELLELYRSGGWPNLVEWIATRRGIRPLPKRESCMVTYRDALKAAEERVRKSEDDARESINTLIVFGATCPHDDDASHEKLQCLVHSMGDFVHAAEDRAQKAEDDRDALAEVASTQRADISILQEQWQKASETNNRLNRRAQLAEAGMLENVEACQRAGVSLGRTLANAAASHWKAEAQKREAEANAAFVVAAEFRQATHEYEDQIARLTSGEWIARLAHIIATGTRVGMRSSVDFAAIIREEIERSEKMREGESDERTR